MVGVNDSPTVEKSKDGMDVDDAPAHSAPMDESKATVIPEPDVKDESAAMQADDDDAVEY
jgi:hypothetical protein